MIKGNNVNSESWSTRKCNEFTGRSCSHGGFVVGAVLKHSFTYECTTNAIFQYDRNFKLYMFCTCTGLNSSKKLCSTARIT